MSIVRYIIEKTGISKCGLGGMLFVTHIVIPIVTHGVTHAVAHIVNHGFILFFYSVSYLPIKHFYS